MKIEILTKEDLTTLKTELLEEIRLMLKNKGAGGLQKEWLKSYEVRKMLGISPGTLQQMRVNGSLEFTQVGGLMYYKHDDILKMMEANKRKNPFATRKN